MEENKNYTTDTMPETEPVAEKLTEQEVHAASAEEEENNVAVIPAEKKKNMKPEASVKPGKREGCSNPKKADNKESTNVEDAETVFRKAAAFYKKKTVRLQVEFRILLLVSLGIVGILGFLLYKQYNKDVPTGGHEAEDAAPHIQVTDLAERADAYNQQGNGTFAASVVYIQGNEYLCMRFGEEETGTELFFCNEDYAGTALHTVTESMTALVRTNGVLKEIPVSYDLRQDWNAWLPEKVIMNGREWFLFLQKGEKAMPECLIFLSEDICVEANLQEKLADWFTVRPGEPEGTVSVTTENGITYCYEATAEDVANVRKRGSRALRFSEQFTYELTEQGIVFTSLVYLADNAFFGELSGTLQPSEQGIRIEEEKYGAYVDFDYEDEGNDKIITPRSEPLSERMVIAGKNGKRYLLPRYENIGRHDYNWNYLDKDQNGYWYLTDDDGNIRTEIGIDVSRHQGEIDWKQVAESGIKFAYIRVGFRGAKEGTLELDEYAVANIQGARENGIRVGVYFYSQAINETEAIEEAEFVLNIISEYDITEEVVWDTEFYELSAGRGNSTSREERTKAAVAFCKTIKAAGYQPMIYANTRWSIMNINRDELAEYPFWFAYYGNKVSYTYEFDVWQYASDGKVPGVKGNCDMNMKFVK